MHGSVCGKLRVQAYACGHVHSSTLCCSCCTRLKHWARSHTDKSEDTGLDIGSTTAAF